MPFGRSPLTEIGVSSRKEVMIAVVGVVYLLSIRVVVVVPRHKVVPENVDTAPLKNERGKTCV
jgi:hypothetical protein